MNGFVICLWKFISSSWRGSSSPVDYAKHFFLSFQYQTWFLPSVYISLFIALTYSNHQEWVSELSSRRWRRWSEREKWKKRKWRTFLICLFIYAKKNWIRICLLRERISERKALKFIMEYQWRVRKWKGFRFSVSAIRQQCASLTLWIMKYKVARIFSSSFCFTDVRCYAFFCVCSAIKRKPDKI